MVTGKKEQNKVLGTAQQNEIQAMIKNLSVSTETCVHFIAQGGNSET